MEDYIRYNGEKLEIFDGKGNVVLTAGPISLNGNLVRRWSVGDAEGIVVYGALHDHGPTFNVDMMNGNVRMDWRQLVTVPKDLLKQFESIIDTAISDWSPLSAKYCTAFPTPEEITEQELRELSPTECQQFVQWMRLCKSHYMRDFYKEWKK